MLESHFNKVAGLKETSTQVLSCEYYENFKNTFFTEHLPAPASDNGKTGHAWCKVNIQNNDKILNKFFSDRKGSFLT